VKATVILVAHVDNHLDDSLESLANTAAGGAVEVILVDNGSADRCGEAAAARYPWLRLVRSECNVGFAGGVHLGAKAATGEVLVLLNDDAAAEEGFVEAHLEALASHPNAAASAGRLTSWDGSRHDFARGAVTFDCHAFQVGHGRPVEEVALPAPGAFEPFACGGNMAIRADDWRRSGGFDRNLFAYFEDVELGWRLWAMGRQVVAAPDAVARHRGAATSSLFGDYRRGVLYERNALRTFFSCADSECRRAFAGAVFATFLHRLSAFTRERPDLDRVLTDPFTGGTDGCGLALRWRRRLAENGLVSTLRHVVARLVLGPRAGRPTLDEGLLVMQLQAARGFFDGVDEAEARRLALDEVRVVPDREILERFPRLLVPTYAGDDRWFASEAFKSLLPEGWPLESRRLDEIVRL
jgi:GT2 family glycosyltransferase